MQAKTKYALSGTAAGLVNGLFGGGGGTVLAPLLSGWCGMEQKAVFAGCVGVIFPLCILSAALYAFSGGFSLSAAWPYLAGGLLGGLIGGRLLRQIPGQWLRRIFACFLLYGGVRYLL